MPKKPCTTADPPSSTVTSLRLSADDLAQAKAAATLAGLSLNAWAIRAMKSVADLEATLRALEERQTRNLPLPGAGAGR